MNKLFSKIAALSVGLAMAVGVGVAVGHEAVRETRAEESLTKTFDLSSSVPSDLTSSKSLSKDGNGRGMGIGGADYTLTSSGSFDNVTKVVVNAATNYSTYSNHKISVTVGGSTLGTQQSFAAKASTDYNFTGSTLSGAVVVSFDNSADGTTKSNTIWCKTIEVWTDSGVVPTGPFTVTYDGNGATSGSMSDPTEYESGATVTIRACEYMRTDYEVTGWNTKADGTGTSYVLSGQFEITNNVTLYAQWKFIGKGSEDDPFTVAEGIAKAIEIGTTASGPWVTKGIICKKTAWDSRYTNVTYWISDDGTESNTIQCFRGKYLNGANVTADNEGEFAVGKIVTVTGNLLNYNGNTPEYAANNYPLSIETPSSGDVDVVFTPETSIEVSDTGTFTATSETAGVVFTWAVDKPEVLSVDETTGEYEALAYGSAKVTVTATAGDKTGTAFAVIVVNGSSLNFLDVTDAIDIASKLESGKTTEYYVCFAGYVREFATSEKDGKPRAFDIQNEKQDASIMVYTNIDPYEAFVDGLQLGSLVRVKANIQNYNGTYELVSPVRLYTEYVAMTFAYELLDETDKVCKDYDDVTNNHDAIEAIWTAMKPKYEALHDAQKNRLVNPSLYGVGETIVNAMERYDYLTGKYDLENFITGRTPVVFSNVNSQFSENNNSSTIIIVIASISVLSFGLALALRKKRTK